MDLLDFRKERRKYYVFFMQYNSIKKSLKLEFFQFSIYSVRRRHELRVARNPSHCNLTIIVAIGRNKLRQLKATNSLTVTSQMLCPLTTTNCGGGRSQNWPLNWPQKDALATLWVRRPPTSPPCHRLYLQQVAVKLFKPGYIEVMYYLFTCICD